MFDRMSDEGIMPGPEHYNPYLMMLAANGQLDKAKKQLGIYYVDAQFSNPNTESFNSLLAGLVKSIRPLGAFWILLVPWAWILLVPWGWIPLVPRFWTPLVPWFWISLVPWGFRVGTRPCRTRVITFQDSC